MYERQRLLSAADSAPSSSSHQSGKRPRVMDPGWDPRARGGPFRGGYTGEAPRTPITPPVSREEFGGRSITCYGCYEEGHAQRNCPRAALECYLCHGRGHRARYCPRRGGPAPSLRLPEAPRPPQLTYPVGQGRGSSGRGDRGDGGPRGGRGGQGDGGFRGGRGRGSDREAGQSSSEVGYDATLPPPPRVFQMSAFEDDYPDPTSTGTIPIPRCVLGMFIWVCLRWWSE